MEQAIGVLIPWLELSVGILLFALMGMWLGLILQKKDPSESSQASLWILCAGDGNLYSLPSVATCS